MTDEHAATATTLGHYAGFATRLVAYVVDQLVLSGILGLVAAGLRFVADALGIDPFALQGTVAVVVVAVLAGLSLAIVFVYDIGFWMLAGQTPGKRLMGVRIIRTNGTRVNLWNCVRREIGYVISRILLLGFLWVLVDNRRQAWHDHLAGTYVIYSWPEVVHSPSARERIRDFRQERKATGSPEPSES